MNDRQTDRRIRWFQLHRKRSVGPVHTGREHATLSANPLMLMLLASCVNTLIHSKVTNTDCSASYEQHSAA